MVVDASALLSIVLDAPAAADLLDAMVDGAPLRMSAATWLELAMTIEARGGRIAALRFDEFMRASGIEIVPVSIEHAEAARTAWRHFGLSRHPDRLDYGDCLTYALAKITGDTLLSDQPGFARTDIVPAVVAPAPPRADAH